ncbi:hypothetical protein D1872_313100 [compost metagenome]
MMAELILSVMNDRPNASRSLIQPMNRSFFSMPSRPKAIRVGRSVLSASWILFITSRLVSLISGMAAQWDSEDNAMDNSNILIPW